MPQNVSANVHFALCKHTFQAKRSFPSPHSYSNLQSLSPDITLLRSSISRFQSLLQNAFSPIPLRSHSTLSCTEFLNEYTAGNSASIPFYTPFLRLFSTFTNRNSCAASKNGRSGIEWYTVKSLLKISVFQRKPDTSQIRVGRKHILQ